MKYLIYASIAMLSFSAFGQQRTVKVDVVKHRHVTTSQRNFYVVPSSHTWRIYNITTNQWEFNVGGAGWVADVGGGAGVGPAGPQGDTGPQGIQGLTGDVGPQGPAGGGGTGTDLLPLNNIWTGATNIYNGRVGIGTEVFGPTRLGDSNLQAPAIDINSVNFKDGSQNTVAAMFLNPAGTVLTVKGFDDSVMVTDFASVASVKGTDPAESTIANTIEHTNGEIYINDQGVQAYPGATTPVADAFFQVLQNRGGGARKPYWFGYYDGTTYDKIFDINTTGVVDFQNAPTINGVAIGAGGTDDQTAAEVTYDGATSALLSTDVQGAIDEVALLAGENVPDGDKGDVVVSSSGSVWTIATNAIEKDMIQNDQISLNKLQSQNIFQEGYVLTNNAGLVRWIDPATLGGSTTQSVATVALMTNNNTAYELTADDLPAKSGLYYRDNTGEVHNYYDFNPDPSTSTPFNIPDAFEDVFNGNVNGNPIATTYTALETGKYMVIMDARAIPANALTHYDITFNVSGGILNKSVTRASRYTSRGPSPVVRFEVDLVKDVLYTFSVTTETGLIIDGTDYVTLFCKFQHK